MRYTFDAAKAAANLAKHGVSFDQAEGFEWDTAAVETDNRREYGESRFIATGLILDRVYRMAFTLRSGGVRIISLRKANPREVTRYAYHD